MMESRCNLIAWYELTNYNIFPAWPEEHLITVKEISLFCFKRNSYFQFLDGRVTETFSKCSKLQPTGIHKKYTIVGP